MHTTICPTVLAAVAAPPRVASPEQSPLTSDVGPKDAPLRSLFPPENPPPAPGAPKLKVAIVGSGLAGLSTAVELLDQGYVRRWLYYVMIWAASRCFVVQEVDIYEQRPFVGGKVASFKDKDGNHIEMGLHVFFGCYFNLFRLMAKCGVLNNLLLKVNVYLVGDSKAFLEHAFFRNTHHVYSFSNMRSFMNGCPVLHQHAACPQEHVHTFINKDGDVRGLDFRFFLGDTKIGAPFHGTAVSEGAGGKKGALCMQ